MTKPLTELFESRTSTEALKHNLKHPCAQTCSGYAMGRDDGRQLESNRRKPIDLATKKLIEALELMEPHWFEDKFNPDPSENRYACSLCDMGDAGEPRDERGHDIQCPFGAVGRALAEFRASLEDVK